MRKALFPSLRSLVLVLMIAGLVAVGLSQKVVYKPKGQNTASKQDYSVSRGKSVRLPRNYDYYYYGRNYSPPVVQYIPHVPLSATSTQNLPAPAIGYVSPHSDAHYSNLVIQEMNKDRERNGLPMIGVDRPGQQGSAPQPATNVTEPSLRVDSSPTTNEIATSTETETTTADEMEHPALRVATIAQVLDHGVLVTSEGARIRLRGVTFPSLNSKHPRRREFAARALKGLEELTVGKEVYFVIEKPEKGLDGCWLAIVHLPDGTELNRLALESGMAIISPNEFFDESEADNLLAAMDSARKNKRGFWADTNMPAEEDKASTR